MQLEPWGKNSIRNSLQQAHGRGPDCLSSQKNLPRRNNIRPASWGVVVDGKGLRRVFLLEKEQTTEEMLSKAIIYPEMLSACTWSTGSVCGGSTSKTVRTCYAMLPSLDMSVRLRGSQSRADWCSMTFTLAAQWTVSWNHAQNSDDSFRSRWLRGAISHQSTSFLLLPSLKCVFSIS